jgi:hypothetical protein
MYDMIWDDGIEGPKKEEGWADKQNGKANGNNNSCYNHHCWLLLFTATHLLLTTNVLLLLLLLGPKQTNPEKKNPQNFISEK